MTTETPPLALPIQVRPSQLPVLSETSVPQKHTIAVLSNWQEQMSPVHCLWFCPHEEMLKQKPNIAFPAVEQCLLLVGTQGNTDFFGHFSPLSAGVTGSTLDQVIGAIDEEAPLAVDDTHRNQSVSIYTIAENDSATKLPPSVAVVDFRKKFERSGYQVELHVLPHDFFGKTLLWNTEKATFERSDDVYEVTLPIPLGRYTSQKIHTEDG